MEGSPASHCISFQHRSPDSHMYLIEERKGVEVEERGWVVSRPDIVTARSVELGSVSPATCMDTPVVCGTRTHSKLSSANIILTCLSYLLDLGSTLSDERTTLRALNDQSEGNGEWSVGFQRSRRRFGNFLRLLSSLHG